MPGGSRKFAPDTALFYIRREEKLTLHKPLGYEPRRREAMKFAPAKKICDFPWPEPSPA